MKKLIALFTAVLMLSVLSTYAQDGSNKKEGKSKMENPQYEITVTQSGKELGKIVIMLYAEIAPKHTHNFDSLVAAKAYDGTAFHRVIPGFMIQGGDPNSVKGDKSTWGFGNPNQTRVPAEFSATMSHKRGMISAARSNDPNSASSQFFICVADATFLDGKYSIYGEVVTGMEIADKIVSSPRDANDNPLEKIEMKIVKL